MLVVEEKVDGANLGLSVAEDGKLRGQNVYDRAQGTFWSVERRNELMRQLDIAVVPELAGGRFDLDRLQQLLGRSKLSDGPAEGLYLRRKRTRPSSVEPSSCAPSSCRTSASTGPSAGSK